VDIVELLIGIAEIATALAGFSGVVVAFGSRSLGTWSPGDRLRLTFLLEASLTAAGFALLALLVVALYGETPFSWALLSGLWAIGGVVSLTVSRLKIRNSEDDSDVTDQTANRITTGLFSILIVITLLNVVFWQDFAPFLAGMLLNLAGAAMQFSRLIRSAFRE